MQQENRLIIAVTGSNAGLGLGYCHRLLRQLSATTPADSTLTPLNTTTSTGSSTTTPTTPVTATLTLTLILACRSRPRAEAAIVQLLARHDLGLQGRRMRGQPVRQGWREGLRVVYEELDVDRVAGKGGVRDFVRRVQDGYPYLTTLVLNAGMGAFLGLDWAAAARQFVTDPVGCVSEPGYIIQQKGKMSADGERGGVWGVNVLSTYILAKELHSHLQKSPSSLPVTPRVIYVSSARADPRFLPPIPADDPQLVDTLESYDASKYVAELVTSALDWEFARRPGQAVRCLRVDPGVVYTGMFKPFLPLLLEWCMVLTFYISRWLGSTVHTIGVENAAIGMTFLTLVSYLSLVPACPPPSEKSTSSPAKYISCITRWGSPRVRVSEVRDWKTHGQQASLDVWVGECERVWGEWKKREEEGWIGDQMGEGEGEGENGSGVKTD